MANENDGEADKKDRESEKRQEIKSAFEVLCHISRLHLADLPI